MSTHDTELNARFIALIGQRDNALNTSVLLAGELAMAKANAGDLAQALDRVNQELEEAKVHLAAVVAIVDDNAEKGQATSLPEALRPVAAADVETDPHDGVPCNA